MVKRHALLRIGGWSILAILTAFILVGAPRTVGLILCLIILASAPVLARARWRRWSAVAAVAAIAVVVYLRPKGDGFATYTEIVEVDYRGVAKYDTGVGQWIVTHTLLVDSATAVTTYPVVFTRVPSARAAQLPHGTIEQVLLGDNWESDGTVGRQRRFVQETRRATSVPWFRRSVVDSILIPTLGRRVFGALMLVASDASRLEISTPARMVVETYPPIESRYQIVGENRDELYSRLPRVEDRATTVRLRIAGPAFRTKLFNSVLNRSVGDWLWALLFALAVAVGVELQRRLGLPLLKRALDRLGVPDESDTKRALDGGDGPSVEPTPPARH